MSDLATAQELVNFFYESEGEDDRSIAQVWEEKTGRPVDPDLADALGSLGKNDAVQGVLSAGAAGVASAQLVSSVLTAIGASTAAVPVVGWVVAAVVVIANTILAGVTNSRALREAKQLGRRQIEKNNRIAELLGFSIETRDYRAWGPIPQFRADQAEAAWWWLRVSELVAVLGGSYMDSGLYGHYRTGLLVDVETSRDYERSHADMNDGYPYVPMRQTVPQIELSCGSNRRNRYYGRGTMHINTRGAFTAFEGGGAKAKRRMSAHLQATDSLVTLLETADSITERRAMIAALLVAAQARFAPKGSRFFAASFQDIPALAETLAGGTPVVGYSDLVFPRTDLGADKFTVASVRSAAPHRIAVANTAIVDDRDQVVLRSTTDGITYHGIFITWWGGGPDYAKRRILIHFGELRAGRRLVFEGWKESIQRFRRVVSPDYLLDTTLAADSEGAAWLQDTAGMFNWPVGAFRVVPQVPLLLNPAIVNAIDLDAGGRDRAAGEGGFPWVPAIIAAGGAYLALKGE